MVVEGAENFRGEVCGAIGLDRHWSTGAWHCVLEGW